MTVPLLLATALTVLAPQEAGRVDRIVELALADAPELPEEVRAHPDAAREAFGELLRLAVAVTEPGSGPLEAADALGRAYFEAWTDPFFGQEARRVRSWSDLQRRARLEADSLRRAGNEAFSVSGVEAAVDTWRQSLEVAESVPDTTGIARALGNLGAGYYAAGHMDSASAYLTAAYDRAVAVGDLRTAASAVTNLASISYEEGEYRRAAEQYGNSLDLLNRTGDARFQSANRHNLALVWLALGDLPSARTSLEESVRLSRLHGYPEDEAEGLSVLADVAMAEGDYPAAALALDESLELARSTGNRPAEAGALHSRGLLEAARGAYRDAERDLARAIDLYEDLDMSRDAAEARVDRAVVLGVMGEIGEGLREIDSVQRLANEVELGPLLTADATLAAADLHALLNEYGQAAADYERAGRLYRVAGDRGGEVGAERGRGLMELTRNNWPDAADGFRQALRAEDASGGGRSKAITRMYLAYALDRGENVREAREIISIALEESSLIGDPVTTAALLGTWGDIELRAGMVARADSLYRSGLATLGTRQVPGVAWRLHAGRAEALAASGQLSLAEAQLERAVEAIERGAAGAALDLRAAYLRDKWHVYTDLAALQVDRGEAEAAFVTSEQLRAGRMLADLAGGRTASPPGDPAGLRVREQDVRRRMVAIAGQLYGTSRLAPGLRESSVGFTSMDLESALRSTQEEYAEVLDLIQLRDLEYAATVVPKIPEVRDLAARLGPQQALVEYVVGDSSSLALVVTDEGARAVALDIARAPLADLVTFARGAIERKRTGSEEDLWVAPLRRLYRELVEPIVEQGWLDGKTRLLIAPHAELHYLPFQALITSQDRREFLIESVTISYTPSAAVWLHLANRREGKTAPDSVLALAPRAADLPGSAYEVRALAGLFGDRARTLTGDNATARAFRDLAPWYGILHLATFGSMNRANPLFSWIDLAPIGDDGRFEVHEIYGLELDARLVVLSACETGLGGGALTSAPAGDDWVGLTRAFLTAGADNVLASLWRVEDLATARLMERFYADLLSGASPPEALAASQRSLIRDQDTAHPFYWAGFSLVGEARDPS